MWYRQLIMQRRLLCLALVALVGSLVLRADARRVGPAEQDSAALAGERGGGPPGCPGVSEVPVVPQRAQDLSS